MTKEEVQAWAKKLEECAAQFIDAMVQFNASKNPQLMLLDAPLIEIAKVALSVVIKVEDIADEWPETEKD